MEEVENCEAAAGNPKVLQSGMKRYTDFSMPRKDWRGLLSRESSASSGGADELADPLLQPVGMNLPVLIIHLTVPPIA